MLTLDSTACADSFPAPSDAVSPPDLPPLPAPVARQVAALRRRTARSAAPITALLDRLQELDPLTYDHCRQVGALARRIAMEQGLGERDCLAAFSAGLLHDIGKLALPPAVLHSAGRLTLAEWALMRSHPIASCALLRGRVDDARVLNAVLAHHERPDGTGYPCHLPIADAITAIVTVADGFDAITNSRAYREAMPCADALQEIARLSGLQYDCATVAALQRLWAQHRPAGVRDTA